MNATKKNARLAGVLYLIYMAFHILAGVIGRSGLIVFGDAATTAVNIASSATQFRIGVVGDLIAAALFLLTAWALYVLLKPVNENLALLFLSFNLVGVVIQCASDLFLLAGQQLLGGADYLRAFGSSQLPALAMSSLFLYRSGFMIAQIFYGAWLFPLGYLVYKSGFLPRVLGMVLMLHCAFWTMTALLFFVFPGFTAIKYVSWPLGFVAECGLALWLVTVGPKRQGLASGGAAFGWNRSW